MDEVLLLLAVLMLININVSLVKINEFNGVTKSIIFKLPTKMKHSWREETILKNYKIQS